MLCFFNETAIHEINTYIHTLSHHDALPICAEAQVAVTERGRISEVGASGPFRRVLNLTEIGDIGRHAADVGDIFLILRVDIAERGRQRPPVAARGDVLAEPRRAFDFESLEARLAGVRHDAAAGRPAGTGASDRTRTPAAAH